jgi:XisH protein
MPAKDRHHDSVVRALVKEGWSITHEQFTIVLPGRFLWIDLRAVKTPENVAMLIEVKGLEGISPVEALASAVGKYALYRAALKLAHISDPLYMAVPAKAFEGILSESIGQYLMESLDIRLIVFDPEQREIIQWTP